MNKIFKINKIQFLLIYILASTVINLLFITMIKDWHVVFSNGKGMGLFLKPIIVGLVIARWLLPAIEKKLNDIYSVHETHDLDHNYVLSVICICKKKKISEGGTLVLNYNKIEFQNSKNNVEINFELNEFNEIYFEKYDVSKLSKMIHSQRAEFIKIQKKNEFFELVVPVSEKLMNFLESLGINKKISTSFN